MMSCLSWLLRVAAARRHADTVSLNSACLSASVVKLLIAPVMAAGNGAGIACQRFSHPWRIPGNGIVGFMDPIRTSDRFKTLKTADSLGFILISSGS